MRQASAPQLSEEKAPKPAPITQAAAKQAPGTDTQQAVTPRPDQGRGTGDVAGPARIATHLEQIRSSSLPVILQVTHALGGGVERHVSELLSTLHEQAWGLVLRPATDSQHVRLSMGPGMNGDELQFALPDDAELLEQLLRGVGLTQIHIHHTSGFTPSLWPWLSGLQVSIDMTLHDYSIVAGSPTLTDEQGRYTEMSPTACYEFADSERARLLQELARSARRCMVPSIDMQQRLAKVLPWLHTQACAHPDRERLAAYPAPTAPTVTGNLKVLCLGALGREKGVEVLRDVATLAKRRGLALEFSLLGSAHVALPGNIHKAGAYQDQHLQRLLAQQQPHLVWFPALWPETWSYTLSAALEAGLPVLATRLGAFPERLQGRPLSWLQDHTANSETWLNSLLDIRQSLIEHKNDQAPWAQPEPHPFYREHYLLPSAATPSPPQLPDARRWQSHYQPQDRQPGKNGWRRRMLAVALSIREWPVLGALLSRLPYNLQRRIKRMLSTAPLH